MGGFLTKRLRFRYDAAGITLAVVTEDRNDFVHKQVVTQPVGRVSVDMGIPKSCRLSHDNE